MIRRNFFKSIGLAIAGVFGIGASSRLLAVGRSDVPPLSDLLLWRTREDVRVDYGLYNRVIRSIRIVVKPGANADDYRAMMVPHRWVGMKCVSQQWTISHERTRLEGTIELVEVPSASPSLPQ